ncbi:Transposable element Tc3 transposase [Holothuria leucospilota]|uniref:Transposable element Tc3 transposase n=1 Tax=Holothuria leucospilota TaxID=206669 RepID=A0A9Q1B9E0_HOLLE|nr:Transposable element Tc3 transposase [Holothuria leucospilota]
MQDNDPKHTSAFARDFFKTANIVWWKTPPESPDLNPIEKIWHELKHFLRSHHKPTTKDQLVDGILTFWKHDTPRRTLVKQKDPKPDRQKRNCSLAQ